MRRVFEMTAAQLSKLQTIIAKIEALQAQIRPDDYRTQGSLEQAKSVLLKAETNAYHSKR